jgi:hypothetical protein
MPMSWNTLFHLHRQVGMKHHTYLPMNMEKKLSETLAYKLQMPVNHAEESTQHTD